MKKRTEYLLNLGQKRTLALCFVVLATSILPEILLAQAAWDITESVLHPIESGYQVKFAPKIDPTRASQQPIAEQRAMIASRTITVTLSTSSPSITYQAPRNYPDDVAQGTILKLDTDDKTEVGKLKELLSAYEAYQLGVVATPVQEQSLRESFKSKAVGYNGILGESVIGATRPKTSLADPQKMFFDESVLTLGPKDEGQRNGLNVKTVPEPSVLLYVLNHLDELQAKYATVVETEQKRLAAQKTLQNEQRLAVMEKQQQAQVEAEALNQKALAYLSSPEGKNLVQQIQAQYKKFTTLKEKEEAYLKPLQERVDTLTKSVADQTLDTWTRQDVSEKLRQAVVKLSQAQEEHKDSPELTTLRQGLLVLFDNFKASSGMGYDDAMKLSHAVQGKQ